MPEVSPDYAGQDVWSLKQKKYFPLTIIQVFLRGKNALLSDDG
jgi:hypothetical protein